MIFSQILMFNYDVIDELMNINENLQKFKSQYLGNHLR